MCLLYCNCSSCYWVHSVVAWRHQSVQSVDWADPKIWTQVVTVTLCWAKKKASHTKTPTRHKTPRCQCVREVALTLRFALYSAHVVLWQRHFWRIVALWHLKLGMVLLLEMCVAECNELVSWWFYTLCLTAAAGGEAERRKLIAGSGCICGAVVGRGPGLPWPHPHSSSRQAQP